MTAAESTGVASDLLTSTTTIAEPLPIQASTSSIALNSKRRLSEHDEMIPAKRQAINNEKHDTDKNIQKKYLGEHAVPISSMISPPKEMLLRRVCSKHKEKIKEGLKKTHKCITVIPVLLIEDKFDKDSADTRYYTLGGNHLVTAMKELKDDYGFQYFNSIRANIYKGLNRTEALRVSSLHNEGTHLTRQRTLKDNVKVCRRELYTLANLDECIDEPPPSKKQWREQCAVVLGKTNPSCKKERNTLEPTFQMALYSRRCFNKLMKIFKINEKTKRSCPKQTVFMKLQGLQESSKFELLSDVVSEKHTLQEMGRKAEEQKKLQVVKNKLVKKLGVSSWEEAVKEFPKYTTKKALQPLTECSFKQGTPQLFKEFINNALEWRSKGSIESDDTKPPLDVTNSGKSTVVPCKGFDDGAVLIIADMENSADCFDKLQNITKVHGREGCTVAIQVSTGTVSTLKALLVKNGFHELASSYKFCSGRKDPSIGQMKLVITATMKTTSRENCTDILVTDEDLMTHTIRKYSADGDWIVDTTENDKVRALSSKLQRKCGKISLLLGGKYVSPSMMATLPERDSSNEDSSNEDSSNENSSNEDSSNENSSNEDSSNEDSSND